MMMNKILVAIPALNEKRTIASVVLLSKEYADSVLVVDDGSTDNTALVAKLAGAQVISHDCNRGKGAAIITAFKWANRRGYDIIVFIDGDGQHNPSMIPKLVRPIERGEVDITIGSRWHHDEGLEEMPFHRVFGNWILSTATSLSLNKIIKDSQSGYRAYSMKTVTSLMESMETGFSVESELIALADRAGFRWKEIGIKSTYSELDTSTQPSWYHGLSVLARAMRVLRIHKPVRFFGALSFLSTIGALLVVLLGRLFFGGEENLSLIGLYIFASLLIMGGFFMFSGIILLGMNQVSERVIKILLDMANKKKNKL